MNEDSPPLDLKALKQRLASLSPAQRAALSRRLDTGSVSSFSGKAAITSALPLRVEDHPPVRIYPASLGQQRMWFLQLFSPDSPAYTVPSAFELVGPLNATWLEEAFHSVIQRHDSLRTTFDIEDEALVQRVTASSSFHLKQINLEAVSAEDRSAALEGILTDESCRPFDLQAELPWRAVLVRMQAAEHVLLLMFHHIISDGWSRTNFLRDLAEAYVSLSAGQPSPLRPLPVQFGDYSAWQKNRLDRGEMADHIEYWKAKLAGAPAVLNLPTDHPRSETGTWRGSLCSRPLPAELVAALKSRAQEEGATLFMILLAAFKVFLHRQTRQDDLAVGVPVANRQHVEVENLIGFFVNTLVMRTSFSSDLTFRELLRRVQVTAVDAYTHQELPFGKLLEILPIRRDSGISPLFQVIFALQDFPTPILNLSGIEVAPRQVTTHSSKFDFSLTVEKLASGWFATAEYSTDLFEVERVEQMLGQWFEILESIASDPSQRICDLPPLSAIESEPLLQSTDRTNDNHFHGKCYHQLFQEQVARTPDAVAVVFEGQSLTYQELNIRSKQLTHHLFSLEVGPEVSVGLCLERSLELVVAVLAVARAGATSVVIDPDLPKQRIDLIIEDSKMSYLLTQSSLLAVLSSADAKVLCLDALPPRPFVDGSEDLVCPRANPESIAYTIYTSGSTGRPKGVLITHAAHANYCAAAIEYWQLTAADRVLQFARLGFDVGLDQLLTPLLVGATVVMRPAEIWDPASLTKVIGNHRLTVVHLPPAYWQKWVESLDEKAVLESLASLRLVQVGGDVMPVAAVKRWLALRLPSVRLINRYGPTETAMFSTAYEVPSDPSFEASTTRVPIGRAVGPRTIHILDSQGNPVSPGDTGEIHIGGDTLARGYLNRPELTAERFIPDRFSSRSGARLYKTGDLGRLLPDGNLDFLGRADYQVKLHGFRIELGEIEAVLGGHPEVASCAVIAKERDGPDKFLVAFVEGRTRDRLSDDILRAWLEAKLPDYMVPSRFVVLADLPLGQSGKVDRKALELLRIDDSGEMDPMLPRDEWEEALIEIWQEVLPKSPLGVHDNFFHLGGHSLVAVMMTSRINQQFGVEVPMGWIFECPTIERLAEKVRNHVLGHEEKPQSPARQFEPKTEAEFQPPPAEWNQMERDYPRDKCIHQLFEAQAAQCPSNVAVEFEGKSLTYEELNRRANQLASHLQKLGVVTDSLVGLYVERSIDMVVALLAILKAGGAYVPLDPALPVQRLEFMIEDATMPVMITERSLEQRINQLPKQVVWLDEWVWDTNTESPLPSGSPSSLVYVIYTSGSTGRPKGVEIPHQALVNCLSYFQRELDLRPHDRMLAVTTLSFDIAELEIWLPLITGARVIVATREVAQDGRLLSQALQDSAATIFQATPATWQGLLQSGWKGSPQLRILCGGETMPQQLADRLAVLGSQAWNAYGPTETTIYSTALRLVPRNRVTIGSPLANTQIYILDSNDQPVAIGVTGELHIGGDGVARGYRNLPDLTAERFIPDPFGNQLGGRLYRTGDLARWLPDGNIDFLGRADQQVKIRGFRIELGEVEAALRGCTGVQEAAVITRESESSDKLLAAYLVVAAGWSSDLAAIRSELTETLPEYMVPSMVTRVDKLPLNANGKVDRKALEGLVGVELTSGTEYVAARSDLERCLVEIWQEVLGREKIGVKDSFFDLGGHSLLAVRICTRINRQLNITLPLRALFDEPTIEGLARRLELLGVASGKDGGIPIINRQESIPLSFAQQGMWLLHQTLADPAAYNITTAWHLEGALSKETLQRCLVAIQARHEVLRTGLVEHEGDLVQKIGEVNEVALPWQEMDLQEVAANDHTQALQDILLAEARRPFDLAQPPLWRVLWVDLGGEERRLSFTFHHSIMDEWSAKLFIQELEQLYEADAQVGSARLPELPIQYADYAAWQRQRLSGERLVAQRDYWQTQLQNLPPNLELPMDLPRPLQPSGRGASHEFQITGPIVTRLAAMAREENATLFMTALAAFQVWLYRYTGQNDLVVATPITGRERQEFHQLLGFFLNTLPIRSRLDGERGFREVLRQLRKTTIDAFDHSRFPFEKMVELAVKERDTNHQPLHQVMFVLLEQELPQLNLGEARARRVPTSTRTSKNDLTLSIQASALAWDCKLEYASDLFTPECVGRMALHFEELLNSIVAQPDEAIGRLNILPEKERHQLLVEWNRTEQDYPRDKCVHQLFEEQVERTPDAVAVVFEGQSLSYRELNKRSNQLAHYLRTLGVGPDVLVGLCVERSFEMMVALLGILKAGGAYVPLDPDLPQQRLATMVADARCAAVLVLSSQLPLSRQPMLTDGNAPLWVQLDKLEADLLVNGGTNPPMMTKPGHLAYVLYTSGSTGRPKGVEMPHGALVNLLHWQREISAMGEGRRTLQFSNLGFDVSFQEIFSTWITGGILVLITDTIRKDPSSLLLELTRTKVERIFLPFVMLEALAEATGDLDKLPADLKEVAVAGEQLRISPAIRRFFAKMPGCQLWNHYGPSETHVVTSHGMLDSVSTWPDLPPIGRPLPNCQIYLLDSKTNLVPVGLIGELHIGGVCLARGYLNRPELTHELFTADPFGNDPAARLYKTGDLARYRPDGTLEFLGRVDHQVKIRGYRVEPGEIESVMGAHPALSSCAVVTHKDGNRGYSLVAALVTRDAEALSTKSMRQWLQPKLPEYMIPAQFIQIPSLPLNANGKVDRHALQGLVGVSLTSGTEYVAARSDLERCLVEIWQEVLGPEKIGVEDSFFDLGGHSLLAVRICTRINCQLNVTLPLRALFDEPTIEGLARRLELLGVCSEKDGGIPIINRQESIPLSFAQQGMWLLHQTLADPAAYNITTAWHLEGALSKETLQSCLVVIQARHEVLRTGLVEHEGNLVQKIGNVNQVALPWQEMDLRGVPANDHTQALQDISLAEARRPFDLAQPPLWRVLWVDLGEAERRISFTFHHSIMDEWSARLFVQELELLYAADAQGGSVRLPELPIQYADYAAWQRQRLSGERLVAQRDYWQTQLQNLPPNLELPMDLPRPLQPSGRGASHEFQLTGPVVTRLSALAREENATLFMTALAAFQVWLYRYTGQNDLVVATPITGRERQEFHQLLGFFLNTLPIRSRLDGGRGFREVLRQLRKTTIDTFDHSQLPFEQMVELAVKERDTNHQPLHQVMFVLLEQELSQLNLGEAHARRISTSTQTSKNDLTFSIQASAQVWDCKLEYASDLFTPECVGRMALHFEELLNSIVTEPDEAIGRLNILPEKERHQLLVEWNRTEQDYPRDKCVHQLFEEQVERTPDAVAVVFEGQSLSYQELNKRSNQLAHHLRTLGVGPDVLVGLFVERSLEMMIALLGILKAGGAYVPLDPDLPLERLQLLLNDTGAALILCLDRLRDRLPSPGETSNFDSKILILEELLFCLEGSSQSNPPCCNAPADLAYVMYTSGSTGQPKGVMIPHLGIVRLVINTDYVELGRDDVMLQFAPLSFDASTFEIWGSLLNGAKLVLLPGGLVDFLELGRSISRHGVTTLWLTAALFHEMMEYEPSALAGLRQLLAGGDVLCPTKVRDYLELPGHGRLINGYGPTENTTFTCCCGLDDAKQVGASVSIGRSITGTQVYILSNEGMPVPVGVTGEIHVGGDGLARGYLNAPALTAERFIPNSFSKDPQARIYRTGDLARWLPDGNIEFLGRADHQVKVRGFRIELGEIETALRSCRGVRDAAVITRENESGDKSLVAFVVVSEDWSSDLAAIRSELIETLPEYMVPSMVTRVDKLPLNANGKVDRRALEGLVGVELTSGTEYVAARSDLERCLIEIWQEVLGREKIGVEDSFFDLGGHSLLAVRVISRMNFEMDRKVSLRDLFGSPTISRLAGQLSDGDASPIPRKLDLAPTAQRGLLPLSFAQQRLWFLSKLEETSADYNLSNAVRLRGQLDFTALEKSINEIVMRHESLRTRFVIVQGEPVQEIGTKLEIKLAIQDLNQLKGTALNVAMTAALQEKCDESFDLETGPLIRSGLIKLDENDYVLWTCFHHIITDGWSMGIFNQELKSLYEDFCNGRESQLKPLPVQYPDFTLWQRQWLQGKELESQLDYWTTKLKGAPPLLNLPLDSDRTTNPSHRGERCVLEIPEHLSRALNALFQQEGASLFMGLLAAFKVLLLRYSGQEDIVIGAPIAGRNHVDLERLIGFFVGTVALRNDLSGDPTFTELLDQVRATSLEAFDHQDLPFEKLIEALNLERSLNHSPVFQVFFNVLNLELDSPSLFDLEVERLNLPELHAKFELTLYVIERSGVIQVSAVYRAELFHCGTIARMLEHFRILLEQVVRNPSARIGSYSLVRDQDRSVLPDPALPLPAGDEAPIHHGFSIQARRAPNRIALVDQKYTWSYAELDHLSNRIANYLLSEGVDVGDVIAVYASRSAELVVCLLAVLKAGGTFVVLDSAYPASRSGRLLEVAKPIGLLIVASASDLPHDFEESIGSARLRFRVKVPLGKDYFENDFLSQCDSCDPKLTVNADDPAYVAFTSGTTGEPLGIVGTHTPISHFLRWHIDQFGLTEDDRFSLLSGLSHDPLIRDVFTPLWLGASLHIPPPETREVEGSLARWLDREKITVCHAPPALIDLIGERSGSDPNGLSSLRWLFSGGDKLTWATVEKVRRWTELCRLVNFYGTTETPQVMSFHVVDGSFDDGVSSAGVMPVGRGIDGVQLLLLNQAGQICGIGELGEIFVRTPYLSKGYLADERGGVDRFRINPFTGFLNDRIYRTGDLGRYLEGGAVALSGRKDTQVKIRGFRVELGEIESTLRCVPEVVDAMVTLEDRSGVQWLVASVVKKEGAATDARELREHLGKLLPTYMLPNAFEWISNLPLTPNGKIDRHTRRNSVAMPLDPTESCTSARNELERELIIIWQRVLGQVRVGVHDNFFDLGGHSLQAVRLAGEIDQLLGCKLPIAALFQSPTIASLAHRLTDEKWAPAWSSLVPLQPMGDKRPLFLVHGWGGDVYGFLGLAKLLGSGQPVYGIQAVGLDGRVPRHTSVEEMAVHYAEEIRSMQPEGPYYLGGYSLGGRIAYEVAQQLQLDGQRVELLALFDSSPSRALPALIFLRCRGPFLCKRAMFHLARWWQMPIQKRRDYFHGRWVALFHWVGRSRSRPALPVEQSDASSQNTQVAGSGDYYQAMTSAHRIKRYQGSADIFVSDSTQAQWMSPWKHLIRGKLSFHRIPGGHHEIMSPEHLPELARSLTSVLHRAQGEGGSCRLGESSDADIAS